MQPLSPLLLTRETEPNVELLRRAGAEALRRGVSAGDAIHLAKVPNRAVIISALGVT